MACPSWVSFILYNHIRKAFTDRKKILDESGVSTNSIVLEVGAGNGFLTEVLAEHAKKVYALELQDGMVRKLKKRVQRFGDKVEIIYSDVASYNVTEEMFDVCLIYYSFHEVRNKINAAKNINKAIKLDGVLSIYEPTIEVTKANMEKTIAIFKDMGFTKETERNRLFTRFVRLRKFRTI
jgi:tRNA A58 N-methylase Trm61